MTKKLSLAAANPYLQNSKKRAQLVINSVKTSTKIEGVNITHAGTPSKVAKKSSAND